MPSIIVYQLSLVQKEVVPWYSHLMEFVQPTAPQKQIVQAMQHIGHASVQCGQRDNSWMGLAIG
jgi:hypothetical protein